MAKQRRYKDKSGQNIYYNIDTGTGITAHRYGQDGEGVFDVVKKVASKLTGKAAKEIATKGITKLAEKGGEKIGEKTGQLIGEKIYDKFSVGKQENKGEQIKKLLQAEKPKKPTPLSSKPTPLSTPSSSKPTTTFQELLKPVSQRTNDKELLNQKFRELLKL